jgi:8-oxo-dGTP pyrophosphatase MutT (NUDIX family)
MINRQAMPRGEFYNSVKIRNNIVTAFIEYRGKVLLLRRSQKVKTMKGKWAGVSGYIEANERPLICALKEIEEETGLTNKSVQVLREGRPLEAADDTRPDIIVWVVHPFYFRTNNNVVNLDWEHDQYKWVNPSEIENFDTVPRLKEALERVYPSIHNKFERK